VLQVPVEEIKEDLDGYLKKVVEGEIIIVMRDDVPIAKISPIERQAKMRAFGSAVAQFTLTPDFDEPLEDFKDYM
jgi:antitoxin (DNA-binding transcriptional repressor) of toxin-antitoxin stability system